MVEGHRGARVVTARTTEQGEGARPAARGRCLVVAYGYALGDPPARQAAESFAGSGWETTLVQGGARGGPQSPAIPGVRVVEWNAPEVWRPVRQVLRWLAFRRTVARTIREAKPELIVAVMLHALAGLPRRAVRSRALVACVYDIPVPRDGGKLDRLIVHRAWKRLGRADVVWASDALKGDRARALGRLAAPPLVAHNCPLREESEAPLCPRDRWLRDELVRSGKAVTPEDVVVLRAGAVGPSGGIEETLEAMRSVSQVVLVLMGRPTEAYAAHLRRRVNELGMDHRVLLWDRPDDATWWRALAGADVGHLVHGPYPEGRMARAAQENSVLSTNRLFQYMKVGLPIVVADDPRLAALRDEVGCFEVVRLEHLTSDLERSFRRMREPTVRRAMGEAAHLAHRTKYHWKSQFEPVLLAAEKATQARWGAEP